MARKEGGQRPSKKGGQLQGMERGQERINSQISWYFRSNVRRRSATTEKGRIVA